MDPHDLLTSEHDALRNKVGLLQASVDQNSQTLAEVLADFQMAIQKHFKHEEMYYRVLDNGKRLQDRGLVHQLRNDHAAVVFTLESLAIRLRKSGLNPDWLARFKNLMDVFLPHLDQEETRLFPAGRKMLTSPELAAIVTDIQHCE